MAHEIGHTIGLRHNFEGSADPLNFFSQYWDVTTDDRYQSGATTNNKELRYSSIMDYHQRFNSDFGGVGIYDKAAIAFGYGQLVEIFDQRASSFVPTQWYNNLGLFDYDDLPYLEVMPMTPSMRNIRKHTTPTGLVIVPLTLELKTLV